MIEPLALSASEAAAVLGCSRWHLYRLVEAGHLRKVPHMGRRVIIARAEIERFLDQAVAP